MKEKTKVGYFARLGPATKNSFAGLKAAYQHEMAFRQELLLCVILTPVAFYLATGFIELVLLMSALFVLLITELLNSAIEAVVDRMGLERHELSGRAKDLGSAAVFVALAYFVMVWGIKILSLF